MQKPWFPRCHSLWNNSLVRRPLYSKLSWLHKESVGVEVSSDSCGLKVGVMKLTETRYPFISTTCQHQGENNKNKGKQIFSCWQQLCLNWVEYFDQNKVPGNRVWFIVRMCHIIKVLLGYHIRLHEWVSVFKKVLYPRSPFTTKIWCCWQICSS